MKTASAVYFGILNLLLFARFPIVVVPAAWEADLSHYGVSPAAWQEGLSHYSSAFHLLSFTLLAVLVLTAGWPVSRAALVALLVAYGAATELVQGLIPYRACELSDCLNDLAGIAAGAAMLWPPRLPLIAALGNPRGI